MKGIEESFIISGFGQINTRYSKAFLVQDSLVKESCNLNEFLSRLIKSRLNINHIFSGIQSLVLIFECEIKGWISEHL